MRLYYHKTDGGAEYLCSNYIEWEHNGKSGREGIFKGSKYIVRIDGDIEKDAELNIKDNLGKDKKESCGHCNSKDIYETDLREGFNYHCNGCGEYLI